MSDWLHDPLRDRFTAIADLRDDSDWLDVRRRARRATRRRAIVTVAAAAAALLLLAAPAFALHRVVVSFFESEPAPERVQLDFARQELGAPTGMAPGAIPDQTRKVVVQTADGERTFVWVAPTRSGGFCVLWKVHAGGCRSRAVGGQIGAGWSGGSEGLTFVYGAVLSDDADRLELRFEDGSATDVPLTWVSPPIDAGFYFVEIPPAHLEVGARPSELVLIDDGGDVLATERAPVQDPLDEPDPATGVPRVVRYDERRVLHSITTEGGRTIELYDAPSRRDGGRCAWLESDGKLYRSFFGCATDTARGPTIGAGILGGSGPVLLEGLVSDDVGKLELRFQDGDQIKVPAVQGFVLAELPRRHWAPGHRLALIVAFDAAGTEVGRKPWDSSTHGVYPCAKEEELDLGLGVTTCP
jgi:hypothetical protein